MVQSVQVSVSTAGAFMSPLHSACVHIRQSRASEQALAPVGLALSWLEWRNEGGV